MPRIRRACLSVIAIAGALALSAIDSSPASATVGHNFADSFGGAGSGDGQFTGGPAGIAVVPSSGDVVASDPGHLLPDGVTPDPRIERFDDAGDYLSSISVDGSTYSSPGGLAIDTTSDAIYVTVFDSAFTPQILKYSAAGAFQYALDPSASNTTFNYAGAAVDPVNGEVYVTALDNNDFTPRIDVFDGTTGAFIESFDGTAGSPSGGFACPSSLAIDGAHRLYVTDPCKNNLARYDATRAYDAVVDDGSAGGPVDVALDATTDEVFVAENGASGLQVASYDATTLARGQTFSASSVGAFAGLDTDPASGTVLIGDTANGVVDRFTAFTGPTVTTGVAAPVGGTSATLNGTVDPGGAAASYQFEYGLDTTYGTSTSVTSAGSGSSAVPATAAISGLMPNETYHYRIIGTNTGGSITGEDQTLHTNSVAPTIVGAPSTASMAPTTVRVRGVINPNHTQTSWHVDYGTDTTYGSSTSPDASAGAGTSDLPVNALIDGLAPSTTYHYRITADNGASGAQHGPDGTFTTAPARPASAIDVSTSHATLVGTIDPHGVATTYHFEYGQSASYGRSTSESEGGSGSGEETVTAGIDGLEPSTTYHVRVVATSGSDSWSGADGTFTTPPAPVSTASAVTGVGTSTATLNGAVDTHGAAGTYQFEVSSLDSVYTLVSPERTLGAGTGARGVSEGVSGLPAGETFTVRLMSNSQDGTGYSDQITFATAPLPRIFLAPPPPGMIGTYGCRAPRLDTYNKRPHTGDVITITGSDLGVGGTASLGDTSSTPTDWTPTGFSIAVPDDASGTLPLTINCGNVSNTVAVAIFQQPSNRFSITKTSVSGAMATLSVKVPGPGKIETSALHTVSAKKTVAKANTIKIAVRLTSAGKKTLAKAKSGRLTVSVKVRFTPAGGAAATLTKSLTFKTGRER